VLDSLKVNPAMAATTTTVAGPSTGNIGQMLSFSATVTSAGGTPSGLLSFRRNGSEFATVSLSASGSASFSFSTQQQGTYRITAHYLGSASFAPSNSAARTVTIGSTPPADMQITTGLFHSCGLDINRQVWCWGRNAAGQLGDGTTTNRLVPAAVPGMNGVIQITTGDLHSCALRDTGRVFCWGSNSAGQLGDTSTTNRTSPVRVVALTGAIQVADGERHSCALRDSGRVFCWGNNGIGQLGNDSTTNRSSPVRVAGMATVSSQRRQPSFESGAQRRLNTIARISASASMSRRDDRIARFKAVSIPKSRQSSWRAKTLPKPSPGRLCRILCPGVVRIPEHAPTDSDNMRPLVPGYPPTSDALP